MNKTIITIDITFREEGETTKNTRRMITEGTKEEAEMFNWDLVKFIQQHDAWHEATTESN